MGGSVRRVMVLGDALRPDASGRPGGTDGPTHWLANAVQRQIGLAAGLPVERLTPGSSPALAAWVGSQRSDAAADDWWAAHHAALPSPPDCLTEPLRDAFCLAYEAPPWLLALLDALGRPWLDVRLHPIRFLDDLLFAVRASDPDTQAALPAHAVPESLVHTTAGLRAAMAQLITSASLPDDTLLVVGQRPLDATQILEGRFYDAFTEVPRIAAACAAHAAVLLKPHPSGDHHTLLIVAANAPTRVLGATRDNLYRLLAMPQIAAVLTVNSSAAYEAPYFGKPAHVLAPLPLRLCWRGDAAHGHASLDDWLLCPDFWRLVLAPYARVTAPDAMRLPAKPNRLRIALDSFWNFQQIDTDRIPRGPA